MPSMSRDGGRVVVVLGRLSGRIRVAVPRMGVVVPVGATVDMPIVCCMRVMAAMTVVGVHRVLAARRSRRYIQLDAGTGGCRDVVVTVCLVPARRAMMPVPVIRIRRRVGRMIVSHVPCPLR